MWKGVKNMYNVLDVCRHVINYSNEKDYGISNLKLQKILYFIQAYFLISTPEQCFVEDIEAWDFGPVVPEAYHEYKQYGSGDIPYIHYFFKFDEDDIWDSTSVEFKDNVISDEDKELMNSVVDKFSDYSATDLVSLTHRQAPWNNAYVRGMNNVIKIEAIKDYFNGK
jgi:prophage ps3 protein 01